MVEKKEGIDGIQSSLKKIIKTYTFGEAGQEFNEFLRKKKIQSNKFSSLELAIENALKDSLKEKIEINILFSPACSSFDEFKNFEERGKYFKKHVKRILKNV